MCNAELFSEDDISKGAISEKLENEADRFAGAFLLPKKSFSKDIYSTSLDHFIQLKKKWNVSIGAMIYRCEALDLLSSNQIKYLKDQMTSRGYWHREPLDNEIPIEVPYLHKQAITLLIENNVISPAILIGEIGCASSEIEQYCSLPKNYLIPKDTENIIQLKSNLFRNNAI